MTNRVLAFVLGLLWVGGAQLGFSEETFEVTTHPPMPNGWPSYDPYFDSVAENPLDLWDRWYRCEASTVTDCLASLDHEFEDEPIWVSNHMQNRFFPYMNELSEPVLNHRNSTVRYGFDDYLVRPLPLWKDIFDDQTANRVETIIRVLQDTQCSALASSSSGGIYADLERYCEAEEMFKYAMMLDACLTSKVRLAEIVDRDLVARFTEVYRHNRGGALIKKTFFRETWIYDKCRRVSLDVVTESGLTSLSLERPVKELVEVAQSTHDMALKIAAKSGNSWALMSYLPQDESLAFWEDLYAVKPSLAHRYLAALGSGLTLDERVQHIYAAYALLQNSDVEIPFYMFHVPGLMIAIDFDWTTFEQDEEAPLTLPWVAADSLSNSPR